MDIVLVEPEEGFFLLAGQNANLCVINPLSIGWAPNKVVEAQTEGIEVIASGQRQQDGLEDAAFPGPVLSQEEEPGAAGR